MENKSSMENLVEKSLFNNAYYKKRVLITGNTGFKGSWLSLWLDQLGANILGVSLKENIKKSHFNHLNLSMKTNYIDIYNYEQLDKIISEFKPEIIFHLAAQPIVKLAMDNPASTFKTNVIGTLNLLESCRKNNVKFLINVTSDKVYKNEGSKNNFMETDIIGGNDLYSSSKACVEIMTESYVKTFSSSGSLLVANVRSGNVIGGGDWGSHRLIPDIVNCFQSNDFLEVRNPQAVRPWQHVLSTISGYLLIGEKLLNDELKHDINFNFGPPENEVFSVNDVIDEFKKKWGNLKISNSKKSFYESSFLLINSSKARNLLKWENVWNFKKSIEMTVDWYDNYLLKNKLNSLEQLNNFIEDAQISNTSWALK